MGAIGQTRIVNTWAWAICWDRPSGDIWEDTRYGTIMSGNIGPDR